MIAAAIGLSAVCSQGAVASWGYQTAGSNNKPYIYFNDGTTSTKIQTWVGDGTAGNVLFTSVLMDAKVTSQDALIKALRTAGADAETYWSDLTTENGLVGATAISSSNKIVAPTEGNEFKYGVGGSFYDMYYAVLVKEANGNYDVLVSSLKTGLEGQDSDTTTISWSDNDTNSKKNFGTADFSGTNYGWYNTYAAPEPTSGLLLLLGVAGLALKRKRA